MAKVLNKHIHGIPAGAVYIGRGSPWGNPFKIGRDGTRLEVIERYRKYLKARIHDEGWPLVEQLANLYGKDLVCFCTPRPCHGDVLLKAAEWAYGQVYARDAAMAANTKECVGS